MATASGAFVAGNAVVSIAGGPPKVHEVHDLDDSSAVDSDLLVESAWRIDQKALERQAKEMPTLEPAAPDTPKDSEPKPAAPEAPSQIPEPVPCEATPHEPAAGETAPGSLEPAAGETAPCSLEPAAPKAVPEAAPKSLEPELVSPEASGPGKKTKGVAADEEIHEPSFSCYSPSRAPSTAASTSSANKSDKYYHKTLAGSLVQMLVATMLFFEIDVGYLCNS